MKLQMNPFPFSVSSSLVAMWELPPDDAGDWSCEPPSLPPTCQTSSKPQRKKAAPKPKTKPIVSKRRKHRGPALLPVDDAGPDLLQGVVDPTPCMASSSVDDGVRETQCDDPTLVSAAAGIPSVVACPYHDLMDMVKIAEPSCSPEMRCHLWELFSPPRIGPVVRSLNGRARRSFDLKHYWDLGDTSFQRTVIQDILTMRPLCVTMSPPCTMVCSLQHSNWKRIKRYDKYLSLEEALNFIDFSMWAAYIQILLGLIFVLEHPEGSLAFGRESVPCFGNSDCFDYYHS